MSSRTAAQEVESPYPGLRPFRRDETEIFFGRDQQVDHLLEKLADSRFLAVVGESGCGKSSLILAGMIPALETGFMASAGALARRDDAAGQPASPLPSAVSARLRDGRAAGDHGPPDQALMHALDDDEALRAPPRRR